MNDARESSPSFAELVRRGEVLQARAESVRTAVLGGAAVLLFVVLVVLMNRTPEPEPVVEVVYSELPDFGSITNVREKKQAFFGYLEPMIEAHNRRVRKTRAELETWRARRAERERLDADDRARLIALGERHRVDVPTDGPVPIDALDALLARVDVIPPSLVLAQAATESAWGTSRFAREANNLFGEWCFTEGCGLVPARRPEGATHEVERFESVYASIDSYFRNLNSHPAYAELRERRMQARADAAAISGADLAAGLTLYSERGEDYVEELRLIMRVNDLDRFDIAPSTQTALAR